MNIKEKVNMQFHFSIILSVVLFLGFVHNDLYAQTIYDTEIQDAFNTHYNYFELELRERLTKDSDGNSDTYVLYDVQTYMQNAAIYADEQKDTAMLNRLLTLTKIPFESQHLTNGEWLNNAYNLVGIEVELVIAQFFSLLTRVLSAGERNGLVTDFSPENFQIVYDHINQWITKPYPVNRNRVDDRHLFFVQSALQFYDYSVRIQKPLANLAVWKQYVQDYMNLSIAPKWEVLPHTYQNQVYDCWMLDRTGWADYADYEYAGYGSEITKTNSDTDPNAMFDSQGIVKQPKKPVSKVGTDISHARRFNWFFETIKRFGKPFEVTISDTILAGWANNLAFRVSQGTLENPRFTIFSDGVDGWYRVNYSGRPGFGYALGDMDIHFVASSYGFFGVYNPKIYDWMTAWTDKNPTAIGGYYGGYALDYYTSLAIDIQKTLAGFAPDSITITTTALGNAEVNTTFSDTLLATGGTPPYTWTLLSGTLPSGLQLNASSGLIYGTPTASGISNFTVRVTDASVSPTQGQKKLSINVVEPNTISLPFRVNCGGNSYTALNGELFNADMAYSAGTGWGYTTSGETVIRTAYDVANTNDDSLYLSERYWDMNTGSYSFNVPDGTYDLRLHFMEHTSWPDTGDVVFDVMAEGDIVLDNFDIRAEVAAKTALVKAISDISVSDGQLNLDFIGVVLGSKIMAIEILSNNSSVEEAQGMN